MTTKKTAKKTTAKPKSTKPATTAEAMFLVASEFSKIGIDKRGYNSQQKFHFRSIDQTLQVLSPLMIQAGLIMTPTVQSIECSEIHPIAAGKSVTHKATVIIRYDFRLATQPGVVISATFVGQGLDSYDKAVNKAVSACFKYMTFQTFIIPLEGCDDSDGEPNHETTLPDQTAEKNPAEDKTAKRFSDKISKATSLEALIKVSNEIAGHYGIGKAPPALGSEWKNKRDQINQKAEKT